MTTSLKNTSANGHDTALQTAKFQVFLTTVRKLLRRGAYSNVRKIVAKSFPADIALLLRQFNREEQLILFDQIEDKAKAAEVLAELGDDESELLAEQLSDDRLLDLFSNLEHDDLADLIKVLPEERGENILAKMHKDRSSDVEKLLIYEDDSAGGIMNPGFFSLHEDINVKEAIAALQEAEDKEMVFYIYVVDAGGHLVGVLSLRQLLTTSPNTPIKSIMMKDVVAATVDTDQEEVARMVSRYNILAIPVVNERNILVGIVTVDDVIDVIREEATEDMLKMAGAGEEIFTNPKVWDSVRLRVPWLLASMLGGLLAVTIIGAFESALNAVIALAGFVPVIIGMGGNVGAQSSTIIVRGIAMKRINTTNIGRILIQEVKIALFMGLIYGLLLTLVTYGFFHTTPMLGPVVGISLCIAMMLSATIGAMVPMIFDRINIDPAVATGPLVTTTTDIAGILVYFTVAKFLLHLPG